MGRIIEPKSKPHHGGTEARRTAKTLTLVNTDDTDGKNRWLRGKAEALGLEETKESFLKDFFRH
jgi:hypothetical protein